MAFKASSDVQAQFFFFFFISVSGGNWDRSLWDVIPTFLSQTHLLEADNYITQKALHVGPLLHQKSRVPTSAAMKQSLHEEAGPKPIQGGQHEKDQCKPFTSFVNLSCQCGYAQVLKSNSLT